MKTYIIGDTHGKMLKVYQNITTLISKTEKHG